MCSTLTLGTLRGQKRVDPLKLELQIVVDHPVDLENQTQVLCKSRKVFSTPEPSIWPSILSIFIVWCFVLF